MMYLLCFVACAISEFCCYKYIKYLDKKERAKLQRWEDHYISSRKEEIEKYLEMQKLKLEEKKNREEELAKQKAKKEKEEKKKK